MTATRSRLRLTAAAALVAAVAIAGVVVLTGTSSGDAGRLAWKGEVQVFASGIPTDEILYSAIENTSLRDVELEADRVRVLDADGRPLKASARFIASFAHGIFPWSDGDPGEFERRRLGEIATVKPGQVVPITLAWRTKQGAPRPVRVDLGPAELPIPSR